MKAIIDDITGYKFTLIPVAHYNCEWELIKTDLGCDATRYDMDKPALLEGQAKHLILSLLGARSNEYNLKLS